MFESINGLPLHPLVVHGAVVIIPLACIAAIVIAVKRSWRRTLGWWVMGLSGLGVILAFVAKESGEALAQVVGNPTAHAALGDSFPLLASALFVVTTALLVTDRALDSHDDSARKQSVAVSVLAVVTVVVAAGVAVQTFRVGESGAEAVWGTTLSASVPPDNSTSKASTAFTLAQVSTHNSTADCWTAIDGSVYNLTAWESEHPGGISPIVALCGTDGTEAFTNQHGGQAQPAQALTRFKVGTLAP